MPSPVSSITRAATRSENEPLNILCVDTHERNTSTIAKTGHNFYSWCTNDNSFVKWNKKYAPIPGNYTRLNAFQGNSQLLEFLDFDLVLSQNKFGQFQLLKQIANQLRLPLISLEHTLPMEQWPPQQLQALYNMKGHINLFISAFSREKWLWGEDEAEIINHGIDTDLFKPLPDITKKRHLLSVVNDWPNRDYFCGFNLWKTITNNLPVHVVGNSPGLSFPAQDVNELVKYYNEAQIFVNTSLVSPIPTSLLEAMSCGIVPVSTATCMIPEIIVNGYNGFISNDPTELRKYMLMLLDNPEKCKEFGANARKTILEKFSLDSFVRNWNEIFYKAADIYNPAPL